MRYERNLCGKRKWIMKTKQQGYSFSIEGVREMSYCSSLNVPMFFCLYEFINTLCNSTPTISNGKKSSNNYCYCADSRQSLWWPVTLYEGLHLFCLNLSDPFSCRVVDPPFELAVYPNPYSVWKPTTAFFIEELSEQTRHWNWAKRSNCSFTLNSVNLILGRKG